MTDVEVDGRVAFPYGFQALGGTLVVLDLTHPLAREHAGHFADALAQQGVGAQLEAIGLTERILRATPGWTPKPFEP